MLIRLRWTNSFATRLTNKCLSLRLFLGLIIKVFFNTPGTLLPHINNGRLRALGITSAQRVDYAPDIPTIAEAAVPDFEAYIWYGIYGPKALPAALVQRWNDAANRYLKSPQAQENLRRSFMAAAGGTPAAFVEYHQAEIILVIQYCYNNTKQHVI